MNKSIPSTTYPEVNFLKSLQNFLITNPYKELSENGVKFIDFTL